MMATGDDARRAPVARQIEDWLASHDYPVASAPLSHDAELAIIDCLVIEAVGCAHKVVQQHSATSMVYAVVDAQGVTVYWFSKDAGTPASERQLCEACDAGQLARVTDAALGILMRAMPPPAPSPPVVTPVAVAAPANSTALVPRRWQLGISVGAMVPRDELDPGFLLGGSGALAIDRSDTWQGVVAIDVTEVGRRDRTELMPPAFPRSAGELDQRFGLMTFALGARVRVAHPGALTLRIVATGGVQLARADFGVYGANRTESAGGPAGTLALEASGRLGPGGWRAMVGWRESRLEFDTTGVIVTSGGLLAIGADW